MSYTQVSPHLGLGFQDLFEMATGYLGHAIKEDNFCVATATSGILLVSGTWCLVRAVKGLSKEKIRNRLFKGAAGVLCCASGAIQLLNTLSSAAIDSHQFHCRKWSVGHIQNIYAQDCNAFGCSLPYPSSSQWSNCLWVAEDLGNTGFSNVYAMKNAPSYT